MFELQDIRKTLRGSWVLDGVTYASPECGTLVISGANGVGKSTLLRIAAGVIDADGGDVKLAGRSLRETRTEALRGIGYLPEAPDLPAQLTVNELLSLTAALKSAPRPDRALLDTLGATPILQQRLGTLSLGQRRRACLAMALTGDPAVLLMDEPTNGLDADGLVMLRELLSERRRQGRCTVLATHDRAFSSSVADDEAVLASGRLARTQAHE